MKFNKLIMTGALALSTVASAFSMGYDFNVGAGVGYYQSPTFSDKEDLADGEKFSQYDWTVGGFLGGGVSFEVGLPMAVGLEYKMEYLGSYSTLKESNGSWQKLNYNSYQHALDVYYKLGLKGGSIPMDLQFNIGLAMLNVLNVEYSGHEALTRAAADYSESENLDYFGLGLHAGLRFNVHMLYLGVDYIYMPTVSSGEGEWTSTKGVWKENKVNLSVGVIFNKAILDSFKS